MLNKLPYATALVIAFFAAGRAGAANLAEQAVAAAEQQWLKAERTNNIDLLVPLLAENVVITTEDGRILSGRSAVLIDAKGVIWASAEETDLKVTTFHDTAIATGTFAGKGADTEGKPVNTQVRFTDTWLKMPNGSWVCIAGHDSPIK